MPTPEELRQLARAEASGLAPGPGQADATDADIEASKRKADQTFDFRDSLFKTILRALVGTLISAVAITGVYIGSEWGQIDPVVLVSFNAAVVVNTIGLAYVVAKYVFPEGGAD